MGRRKSKEQKTDEWIAWWKPRLLLDKWAVIPSHKDKDITPADDEYIDHIQAQNTIDLANSECHLVTFPILWNDNEEGYQHMTIGHELAHIHTQLVAELLDKAVAKRLIKRKDANRLLEDLTTTIAKIALVNAKKRLPDYHI